VINVKLFDMYLPTRIVSGEKCVISQSGYFSNLGKRCMILTSGNSAELCGALTDIKKAFKKENIEYILFDELVENPTLLTSYKAGEIARNYKADYLLAVGGGSVIDGTKAAAVFASMNFEKPEEIYSKTITKCLNIAVISTTAGTGSEIGNVIVLTEDSNGIKRVVVSNEMFPKVAFYDYRYTMTMPIRLTVATGLDALCHCVESWFSTNATELSNLLAMRGTELTYSCLKKIADGEFNPNDEELRRNQHYGSLYGGMAIALSGTGFPHPAGYILTENASIPHGVACAFFETVFLEHSIKYVNNYEKQKFLEIVESLEDFKTTMKILLKNNITMSLKACEDMENRVSDANNTKRTLGGYIPNTVKKEAKKMFLKENQKEKVLGNWTFGDGE